MYKKNPYKFRTSFLKYKISLLSTSVPDCSTLFYSLLCKCVGTKYLCPVSKISEYSKLSPKYLFTIFLI